MTASFALWVVAATVAGAAGQDTNLQVRITSPLGRTGSMNTIRVVAQVRPFVDPEAAPPVVRFYVDGKSIGEDVDGPPFAVEWVDENPFEAREITVDVVDEVGRHAEDRITLKPFEIVEASEVVSVLLEATVEDGQGKPILSLTDNDFTLLEDGVPQGLDMVRQEVMPATYLILLDSSQSMSRRIDFVKGAARRLTAQLRKDDRVIVAPFSKQLGAITGPTGDRDTIIEAIGYVTATGGTAIVDSIVEAATLMRDLPGRHAIVLLTDGYDEHSTHTAEEALAALKQSHTTAYIVGIGGVAGVSIKGERFLRGLARQSAGRIFFPSRDIEIPAVHEQIAADVRQRYQISYTPTNQRRDGQWRDVALSTINPEWKIRTRSGYFAPEPAPVRPSLEFTVLGTENQYVEVSKEDLVILEDGVPQELDTFQEAVAPVSILLTLDQSGSMVRAAAMVKDAARQFVTQLPSSDSLGVALFSDATTIVQDLTRNREDAAEAIDQYVPRGGTALYDALGASFERLRSVEGRRIVVILTDGRDENNAGNGPGSRRVFEDVVNEARTVEATVFAIGLGPNVDRSKLEMLAATTGGLALFPTTVDQLQEEYGRIVENLRRRYVISYASTNTTRDGQWRAVEIHSQIPSTAVTSRGGYFAPEEGK
jgi:VWFA-related protein